MAATDLVVETVLMTGSNTGIGLGMVKLFLTLPTPPRWIFATVYKMNDSKNKELMELASQNKNLVVLQLDVTDLESIKTAVEEVQKYVGKFGLTLLMNNAAICFPNDLETENAKDMSAVYATNTIGPQQVTQAFLPLLKMAACRSPQRGLSCSKAAVINTSSAVGSISAVLLWDKLKLLGYRCSKTALNMVTRCQSLVYAKFGILCVCIHPGWVQTRYPEADLTVEESTQGIMNVLSRLSEEDNGTFVDWEGCRVPW